MDGERKERVKKIILDFKDSCKKHRVKVYSNELYKYIILVNAIMKELEKDNI